MLLRCGAVGLTFETDEIEAAINAVLSRKGIAAKVIVNESTAELKGRGTNVAIDIGEVVKQWPLLPPDIRARKINAAVKRLLAASDGKPGRVSDGTAPPRRRERNVVIGIVAIALVVAGIHWLRQQNFFGPVEDVVLRSAATATTTITATAESEADRRARAARVCNAARSRIRSGGNMVGLDFEGWEVVLWVAKREADAQWAATTRDAAAAASLGEQARAALEVGDNAALRVAAGRAQTAATSQVDHSVAIRLSGDYVGAFLQPTGRTRFIEFATRFAVDTGADLAALFGTCAHLEVADMGAWYWGRDEQAAVAALLFAAGQCAEPPLAKAGQLPGAGPALKRLLALAARVDAAKLTDVLREQGGTLQRATQQRGQPPDGSTAPAIGVSLRFPLGGPMRASAASRALYAAATRR